MTQEPSDSQLLDMRFPGYAWMPRWTRKYWTPSTAVALTLFVFSVGVWWGTWKSAADVSDLKKDLGSITALVAHNCTQGCLVKKEDLALMQSHVDDLWKTKQDIDAEMARAAARREAAREAAKAKR